VLASFKVLKDDRLLNNLADYEDAAIVRFPAGKAMVQSVDILTPIVNNPYWFGQIAAANSLSDVYAMGGEPYTAMNIVCFPIHKMGRDILKEILAGGMDKVRESGAVMAGGHSIRDEEIKYGLSVTGTIDPEKFASNNGLKPGDHLLLTKPIGTGVLSTALKAGVKESAKIEELIYAWGSRLNKAGGKAIEQLGLKGATDITGFGLGGHLLELARASGVSIELWLRDIPFIDEAVKFAGMGFMPGGSAANKKFCQSSVTLPDKADSALIDLVFDAQTSGGLVLAVPQPQMAQAQEMLLEAGDLAVHIGQVVAADSSGAKLRII